MTRWIGWTFVGLLGGAMPAVAQSALPLHEVPAAPGTTLALFISGDGGWAGIDRDVAAALARAGVAVVGLDAKAYLGSRKTPETVAADLTQVLDRYLARWHRDRIAVVGYSRGADLAPFIVNRLPDTMRERIDLVAMLGLGLHAGFHVTLFDLLHSTTSDKDPPVAPEIEALRSRRVPMLCVYGIGEKESLCRQLDDSVLKRVARPGAHHFDGDHAALAADILAALPDR